MAQGWRSIFPYTRTQQSHLGVSPNAFARPRRLAQEIFHFHTKGLTFDPKRSGAEWWVQIRDAGARFCSFLCFQAGLGFSVGNLFWHHVHAMSLRVGLCSQTGLRVLECSIMRDHGFFSFHFRCARGENLLCSFWI